jgi:hypothetical protein
MNSEFPQFITARKKQAGNDHLAAQDNTCFQESHIVSSRTLKRLSPYSSHTEEYTRKMRAVEKEGERQRFISESPSPLLKKVDAIAYPRVKLGEKYMPASSNNKKNGYFELEREISMILFCLFMKEVQNLLSVIAWHLLLVVVVLLVTVQISCLVILYQVLLKMQIPFVVMQIPFMIVEMRKENVHFS